MKNLFLLVSICFVQTLQAQLPDTLQLAQGLVEKKEFFQAERLLHAYHLKSGSAHSYQLHAHLLYWLQKPEHSMVRFELGLAKFPEAKFLELDYGRMLYELGHLKSAEDHLNKYLASDSLHLESNMITTYLQFWKGDASKGWERIQFLKNNYASNEEVRKLENYAKNYYTDFITSGYKFTDDDQPLQNQQLEISYNAFRSRFFTPSVKARGNFYAQPSLKSIWLQAANTFTFNYSDTKITTEAGVFSSSNSAAGFTGSLKLKQKLTKAISINLFTERRPYQYTVSSIQKPFLYNLQGGHVNVENKIIQSSLGMEFHQFDDDNKITNAFAWGLVSLVKNRSLSFMAGYGYSSANSRHSRFKPGKSLDEIVLSQGSNTQVQGTYQPYFTPLNQKVHSLLSNFSVRLSKASSLKGNISYGFSAKADNPTLFLEKSNANEDFIKEYRYSQSYNPMEGELSFNYSLSGGALLQASYKYSKLFFYTRNEAGLRFIYPLVKSRP